MFLVLPSSFRLVDSFSFRLFSLNKEREGDEQSIEENDYK